MKIKIFQVDAFTDKIFSGNPAAVCPLDRWLEEDVLQNIAAENNLAETAFYIKTNSGFQIRWFTPIAEVDLCGHATLATAYILFEIFNYKGTISFDSRSGILTVTKDGDWIKLNFPADKTERISISGELKDCFDKAPVEAYQGIVDYMLIFDSQQEIESMKPNLRLISQFKKRGIIVTAKGLQMDFVSRYFAPAFGIDEDPVTGSAHTTLIPYWSKKLNKTDLTAMQLSRRTGYLKCSYLGERVEISGQARLYLNGEIEVN